MSKILVIDDEKSIRNTLKEILEYEKHKVELAENGIEGLEKLRSSAFDIILCDIKMPEMDGIEVLEKVFEITSDTPIIMISGHGNIDTAVDAIKKGAFDFIEKPLDLNRLLITIKNAVDRSDLITETKVLKRKVYKTFDIIGESSVPIQEDPSVFRVGGPSVPVILLACVNCGYLTMHAQGPLDMKHGGQND